MKRPMVSLKKATTMVPNLFTVGNMALGFFAIMAALDGRWFAAPSAIFLAHIFDVLDGRLARWLNQTSPFGGEFDSFADWISFGIAPSLMMYLLVLKDFGQLGFLMAFFYVLAGAIRLARFNVKATEVDKEPISPHFIGLPIPVAGGFMAILVLLFGLFENDNPGRTFPLLFKTVPLLKQLTPVIVFSVSLLMVSRVPYATMKKVHFFRPQSAPTFFIALFICFMIYAYPQNMIFIMYAGYILWGLVKTGWRAYRMKIKKVPPDDLTYGEIRK